MVGAFLSGNPAMHKSHAIILLATVFVGAVGAASTASAASATQHPSDVLACHDHRRQLLQELHAAQAQLASVQRRVLSPPYYGGPALGQQLVAFTQWKQATEARLIARINAINAEGQREANCIVARERKREKEKLANFQSVIWENIASRSIAYFKGGIVELVGEYFDGGEDVGHDPNRGVGRVMSRIAHYQGRTFNDTDPSALAAETAFNDVLSGSMLMRMKHHIDPKSAVKVVAVGDQAKRMEAACLPPNRASLSPCYGAEITGKIRKCVAPQNFPGRAQEIADREWGRWLCLYATSIKPFDRNFNPVFAR
jgi:hypothetical protein